MAVEQTTETVLPASPLEQTLEKLHINADEALKVARASYSLRLPVALIAAHYPTERMTNSFTSALLHGMQLLPLSQTMALLTNYLQDEITQSAREELTQQHKGWNTIGIGTLTEHLSTLQRIGVITNVPDAAGNYIANTTRETVLNMGSNLLRWHVANPNIPSKALWGRTEEATNGMDNVARRFGILATIALQQAPQPGKQLRIPISEFVKNIGIPSSQRLQEDLRVFKHELGLVDLDIVPRNTPLDTYSCTHPDSLPSFREGTIKAKVAQALQHAFVYQNKQRIPKQMNIIDLKADVRMGDRELREMDPDKLQKIIYRVLNDWEPAGILQKQTRENTYVLVSLRQYNTIQSYLRNFSDKTSLPDPTEDPEIVAQYMASAEKSVSSSTQSEYLPSVLRVLLTNSEDSLTQEAVFAQVSTQEEGITLNSCADILADAAQRGLVRQQARRGQGARKFYALNITHPEVIQLLGDDEIFLKKALLYIQSQKDTESSTEFADFAAYLLTHSLEKVSITDPQVLAYALQIAHTKPAFAPVFKQLLGEGQKMISTHADLIGKDPKYTQLALTTFSIGGGILHDDGSKIDLQPNAFAALVEPLRQCRDPRYISLTNQYKGSQLFAVPARTFAPAPAPAQRTIFVCKNGFKSVTKILTSGSSTQTTIYTIDGEQNGTFVALLNTGVQLLMRAYRESKQQVPSLSQLEAMAFEYLGNTQM